MLPGLLSAHTGLAEAIRCVLLLCSVSAQTPPGVPDDFREAWLALVHYWDDDGGWLSEVEDPSFFLDVEGPRSPELEWSADRRAFLAPADEGSSGQHARCRFPARFALMKEALSWSDGEIPRVDCPEVEAHQRRLRAKSLSAVFVSHYLNNPASAFGHIMLYLGSDTDRDAALADYSVSFEADTEGMTPAEYVPRGLFGGLVAGFRLAPLHERVRKYERQEQRDLWLFPLQLSQDEIDQIVRHLWELKDVTFRYGFFGGNCAQKILTLVHAVAPEYELLPYGGLATLPQEVARRLVEQIGLAGEPMNRPSLESRYARQVAKLSPQEKEQLERMVASRTVVESASPATLSAALLWSELKTPYRSFRRVAETEDHKDFVWRRALWTARVDSGDGREDQLTGSVQVAGPSLLQAHRPSRVTLRGGYRNGGGSVLGVGARWLLHGPLDPHVGYPLVSSVEIALIDFDVSAAGELLFNEATAFRIEKLAPASGLQSPLAWKIDVGARRLAFNGESPLHIGAEVGIGAGTALLRPGYSVAFYSMLGARPGAALANGGTSFLLAGIWSGGLLLRLPADFRARVSGEYALSLTSLNGGAAAFNAVVRKGLTRNWDLELAATLGPERSGVTLGVVSFR